MSLRPPSPQQGDTGLEAFRKAAKLYETTLRSRLTREFYRKDLSRWRKLYSTLAGKRLKGSHEEGHFVKMARLCGELLAEYGPEPPPKRRPKQAYPRVVLRYPEFADEYKLRVHFLETDTLRTRRALDLANYVQGVFRQVSGKGRTLVSIGMPIGDQRLFARIADTLGPSIVRDLTMSGFDLEYGGAPLELQSGETRAPQRLDPDRPLARVWADNRSALSYVRPARRPMIGALTSEVPEVDLPEDIWTWDPDARFHHLLQLTDADRLHDVVPLLEAIPGDARELLFEEVIYLRFLTHTALKAQDIRFLARKHALSSLISGRLMDEFANYLGHIDEALRRNPPVFTRIHVLRDDFGARAVPPWPPASDWPAYRDHYAGSAPPGRIFQIYPAAFIGDYDDLFRPYFLESENAFRRERGIPEIGRGWASEVALYDLVRDVWPSAIHQWRPGFLGLQSVDIYVPELRLAIEYQGQQHYEPVALFGGEDGFNQTRLRDEKKRAVLEANGVRLLWWRYDRPITLEKLGADLRAMGIEATGVKWAPRPRTQQDGKYER